MSDVVRVLSIDGGGIRGLIPALVLSEIERRTGQRTADLFDLIAGTSTGGLLGLALVKPGLDGKPQYTADDVVKLYENEGTTIFSRTKWHELVALGNLVEERYPSKGIESVLLKYFGEAELKDALKEIFVTAYEIERRDPFFFRSARAKDPAFGGIYNFKMRDVARGTSAAPTYFEPARIVHVGGSELEYSALVDGGVFANNPAMCAYVEAVVRHPGKQIALLSLGTGQVTTPIPYDRAKKWGVAEWAQPILDVVFDGVCDTVDFQLQQLCSLNASANRGAGLIEYHRLQAQLDAGLDSTDNASSANLHGLRLQAQKLISANQQALDQMCGVLTG